MKMKMSRKKFWVIAGLAFLIPLSIILALNWGSVFGPSPYGPASIPPELVAAANKKPLTADEVLQDFPNVARSKLVKGAEIDVVGKVFAVRTASENEPADTSIELVGTTQAEDNLAHFTCQLDLAAKESPPWINSTVKVTGVAGDIDAGANRINIVHGRCTTLEKLEMLNPHVLVGRWCAYYAMTPDATRQWASKDATVLGAAVDSLNQRLAHAHWLVARPTGYTLSPLGIDLTFRADGTLEEVLFDAFQPFARISGTWSLSADADTLKITLEGGDTIESSVGYINGSFLKIKNVAGLADLNIVPEIEFNRVYGTRVDNNFDLLKEQTETWANAKLTAEGAQQTLRDALAYVDSCKEQQRWYSMIFDGGLTSTGKTTELCAMNGTLYSFELSDAQTQSSGVGVKGTKFSRTNIHMDEKIPEVKIESFELDGDHALSLSKHLTGKITVRLLSLIPNAGCVLVMEEQHGVVFWQFSQSLTLDNQTFEFSMPKVGGGKRTGTTEDVYMRPDPLPVFFSVCRKDDEQVPSGLGLYLNGGAPPRASDSISVLLDVRP